MKLSTRSRYGVRLLFELALNYKNGNMLLKEISKKQDISEKYLSNIIVLLRRANLVNSERGAHGGYTIAKKPSNITIKEIVDVLEGSPYLIECIENNKVCKKKELCPSQELWKNLDNEISKFLQSITLQNLVDNFNKKQNKKGLMFHI
jgi:Rrf2 family transcriptional regulator, cysteine metabolism repressor